MTMFEATVPAPGEPPLEERMGIATQLGRAPATGSPEVQAGEAGGAGGRRARGDVRRRSAGFPA